MRLQVLPSRDKIYLWPWDLLWPIDHCRGDNVPALNFILGRSSTLILSLGVLPPPSEKVQARLQEDESM